MISGRGDDPDSVAADVTSMSCRRLPRARPGTCASGFTSAWHNRGTWQAQGGYDAIAEQIFQQISADVFLLEYGQPARRGFEPLRKLPDDKMVILGLLSTKQRLVEDADQIIARIREAENFVPLERLGVSPQCASGAA